MKKLLLFSFLLPLMAVGQISTNVQYVTSSIWNVDHWANSYREDYEYDTEGRTTRRVYSSWNDVLSDWQQANQYYFTYNTDGQLDQTTSQTWNTTGNSWQNFEHSTSFYNASGQKTQTVGQIWSTDHWINKSNVLFTYDENNYLVNSLRQNWDNNSLSWANNSRTNFVRNSAGLVIEQVIQQSSGISWFDYTRYVFTYNDDNQLASSLYQEGNGGWVNTYFVTYTYDANHYLINRFIDRWENNAWVDDSQVIHTNNANGTVSESITSDWNWEGSGIWTDFLKQVYTYPSLGVATNYLQQLLLYPNPTNNHMNLVVPEGKSVDNLRIVDARGKTLPSFDTNTDIIDVSGLPSGMYLLQMELDGKTVSKKFIKN